MSKKRALGRGLSALLEDSEKIPPTSLREEVMQAGINDIDIAAIVPNPKQPRKHFDDDSLEELAASIRQYGIIQPITVRKTGKNSYEIISGERRWRAAKLAGLKHIPAYVRTTADRDLLALALIENLQREDLDAIEIAQSYRQMIEELDITHDELSKKIGKSRPVITNYLRLLNLPDEIQAALKSGKISTGHARVLSGLENDDLRKHIFREILTKGISVRQTEKLAKTGLSPTPPAKTPLHTAPLTFEQQKHVNEIMRFTGRKVEVKQTGDGSGRLAIYFKNEEDLTRILELLNP